MLHRKNVAASRPTTRVAIITDSIYPYNKGGKEMRLYQITTRLAEQGADVHIYTMKWWDGPSHIVDQGVQLHAISKHYPLYAGQRRSIRQGIMFALACLKLAGPSFHPDVIEVDHMPYFPLFTMKLVALVKRRPLLATWHEVWGGTYWRQYLGPIGGTIAATLERLTILMPNKIIASSQPTAERLQAMFHVKKPIVVISNGVDAEQIASVAPGVVQSDIIYAGRLLGHKNVDMIVRAVATLAVSHPTIRCVIIGDGPERERIQQLAHELRVSQHIQFLGFLGDHSDVIGYLKASKVFAFPSTREGFGITVLEANAAGVPVITPDYPDNAARTLIHEGQNGLLCAPEPADLAEKIALILDGEVHFTKKIIKAQVASYHWGAIAEQASKLWQVS